MGSTSGTLLGRLRDLGDAQAWQEFTARYTPRLLAWCRGKGLQETDALEVTQNVLLRVARRMPTFVYDPRSNFSGWLHAVWQNAWNDFVTDRTPGGRGSGDPTVDEQLRRIPGGDLTEELDDLFEGEMLEEALARVGPHVSPRDWQIFMEYLSGQSGTEVAKKHGMTLAAVGMIRLKVQRKVSAEVAKLEGSAQIKEENGP